jgi:TetR/AcrR family transcriptional regulator, biofilm operon repressor
MKDQIKQAALSHLNKFGYEGVKMAHIAAEACIKKQSLSYYYASKKELVIDLYTEVVEKEIAYVESFFEVHKDLSIKEQLYQFLWELKIRTQQQAHVLFLQMTAFMAPFELKNFIASEYNKYLHAVKREVLSAFSQIKTFYSTEESTIAFLTILDGLLAKIIYEPAQPYEELLDTAFSIFWRGIS